MKYNIDIAQKALQNFQQENLLLVMYSAIAKSRIGPGKAEVCNFFPE
jgi:hypothetical protein